MNHALKKAGLSVDLDSAASHLRGYGIFDCAQVDEAYKLAVPRILERFSALGVRATFFLIAEEASRNPEIVKSIVKNGHEIGCHSMTHVLPFDVTNEQQRQREIFAAKALLEDISGTKVLGFRAPTWHVTPYLLEALLDAEFLYDSSFFPSWMLLALRASVASKGTKKKAALGLGDCRSFFGRPDGHRINFGSRSIVELPISTTPFIRFPYYHTLNFLIPASVLAIIERLTALRRFPIHYILHAVDFLNVDTDKLDSRLSRHPGLTTPLELKLELVDKAISRLKKAGSVVPLIDIARRI